MSVNSHTAAERLARALDAEDYLAARECLAEDCVYNIGATVLTGPDAILASYRTNGESARTRFEEIVYFSQIEALDPTHAVITYTDRLRRGDLWHEFRCRQHVIINDRGRIVEIRHEELPGERERLHAFESGCE